MIGINWALSWFGARFARHVRDQTMGRLERAAQKGTAVAKRLVPVDTGQTRDSIGYTIDRKALEVTIHADTRWAIFLEFGTRFMRARPFLRPALAAAAQEFGGGLNTAVSLPNAPTKYQQGYKAMAPTRVTANRHGSTRHRTKIGDRKS